MPLSPRNHFGTFGGFLRLAGLIVAGHLAISAAPARASAGEDAAERPDEIVAADRAIDHKDYGKAIHLVTAYLQQNPGDADGLTVLGTAYLDSGDTANAIATLEKSLTKDSGRLETNAELGRAYLMAGNVPAAEARLRHLDRLCFFGCNEERQLKAEIGDYKSKH